MVRPRVAKGARGPAYWGIEPERFRAAWERYMGGERIKRTLANLQRLQRQDLTPMTAGNLIAEWAQMGLKTELRPWAGIRGTLVRWMYDTSSGMRVPYWAIIWALKTIAEEEYGTGEDLLIKIHATLREKVGDAELARRMSIWQEMRPPSYTTKEPTGAGWVQGYEKENSDEHGCSTLCAQFGCSHGKEDHE